MISLAVRSSPHAQSAGSVEVAARAHDGAACVLGHEDAADLRTPLHASEGNDLLIAAIREGVARKPNGHDFIIDRTNPRPAVARQASVTGGQQTDAA